jgi:O-antigen ligase
MAGVRTDTQRLTGRPVRSGLPAAYQGISSIRVSDALERVYVILALMLFAGTFFAFLAGESQGVADVSRGGNPFIQAGYVGVYGIAFLLIITRARNIIDLVVRDPLLLVLVGIALFSVFWSAAPSVTLRGGVALVGTTLFGAYLAARFDFREQLRLLAWALGIAALLSAAVALLLPSYGVESGFRGEAWQGVFYQKNVLGRLMALGAVVFLLTAVGHGWRWLKWAGFGLAGALVVMANSATSLVALVALLAVLPLYAALRGRYTFTVPFFIAMILGGGLLAMWFTNNSEAVFSLLGREGTFTGRTNIWSAVLDKIWERPWLGYGYGGFWLGWEGESAEVLIVLPQNNVPTHSHNGFLDLWLDLGLLGLVAFVARLLLFIPRAVQRVRSTRSADGLWPLAYLTLLLLYAPAYPVGLEQNSIWWVLYVAATLPLVSRSARVEEGRPYSHTSGELSGG